MAQSSTSAPRNTQGSRLFNLAREIDARMRERSRVRKRNYALDAFDLLECKRLDLHRMLGYSSITAYARAIHEFGSSMTSSLIKIAEACQRLPKIREAFLAGELGWCAAREIVKKATPEDEEEWLRKERVLTVSELKAIVQEKDPRYRRVLDDLTADELAWLDAAADVVRKQRGPFALGSAIAQACRSFVEGEVQGGSSYRMVIYDCATCGEAVRQTSEGLLPVSREEVDQARCDTEILDVRNGPAKLTRFPPPKAKRYIQSRDMGRCVIPGCRNRGTHTHHGDGYRAGHDPKRCWSVCDSHHDASHRGLLRDEGEMPDLHFFLADGTYLGRAGDEKAASEASRDAAAGRGIVQSSAHAEGRTDPTEAPAHAEGRADSGEVSAHAEGTGPNPVDDAIKALQKLGFRAGEAKASVQRVLRAHPERSWDAGELAGASFGGDIG